MSKSVRKKIKKSIRTGKLRIADHWNAISIIAKSQANPLKAVAEFVENSIDAGAKQIVIVRGKKKGEFYIKVSDDGEGIPRNAQGLPDFRRVATHICDSIKRQFKSERAEGIQGLCICRQTERPQAALYLPPVLQGTRSPQFSGTADGRTS